MAYDPSRTTVFRRKFVADVNKRFRWLKGEIIRLIVTEDSFGLKERKPLQLNEDFVFETDDRKLAAFQKWLKQKTDVGILEVVGDASPQKPWTGTYVESAYKKGVVRAYVDANKQKLDSAAGFIQGSKAQFLQGAFAAPETVSKIQLLATRSFENLKGITATMSGQLNRIFADGLSAGKNPVVIASEINNTIDKIGAVRARTLARTEIIHAHAEGQLDSFERLGVEELGLMAEWSTAGDDRVCPQCAAMEGVILSVKEARGLIPLHPNCRCVWIPAAEDITRKRNSGLYSPKTFETVEAAAVDQFGSRVGTIGAEINKLLTTTAQTPEQLFAKLRAAGINQGTIHRVRSQMNQLIKRGYVEHTAKGYRLVSNELVDRVPPPGTPSIPAAKIKQPLPGIKNRADADWDNIKARIEELNKPASAYEVDIAKNEYLNARNDFFDFAESQGVKLREFAKDYAVDYKTGKWRHRQVNMTVNDLDAASVANLDYAVKAEYEQLLARMQEKFRKWHSINPDVKYGNTTISFKDRVHEILDVGDKGKMNMVLARESNMPSWVASRIKKSMGSLIEKEVTPLTIGRIREAHAFLEKVVNKNIVSKLRNIYHVVVKQGRAHYSDVWGDAGYFVVPTFTDSSTILHEITHAIEAIRPDILHKTKAFLEKRTVGEKLQKLSKLTGHKGYRANELAWEDKWQEYGGHHYMGKYYADYTELLTMGIERLYSDPLLFYRQDPEYFEFLVRILRDVEP